MPEVLLATARAAAEAGASVVRRLFRDATLGVERKGANDFVTEADRGSERAIVEAIRRRHPDHAVLAEEGTGGGAVSAGQVEWLIDPLDGTTNFLQGLPMFCVSVACRRDGELLAGVVLDPVRDEVFEAARGAGATWNGRPMRVSARPGLDGAFLATGYPFKAHAALDLYLEVFRDVFLRARAIRRCGAAALDLAYTAAGVYDGFFEFRLSPWDIAAGALLIAEAGGVVSDLDGGPGHLATGNVVAGNPAVQPELLAVLRRHGGERAVERLDPRQETGAGAGAPAGVPETAEPVGAAAGEPRGGGGGMP
jgi:myo-inositol-1(or 4)-monophosphatase